MECTGLRILPNLQWVWRMDEAVDRLPKDRFFQVPPVHDV